MPTCINDSVRLAIIGCGAVAEEMYLPAADLVPKLSFVHVVDLDTERAREIAERFRIPGYGCDFHEALGQVDGVVVATPPSSHARIAIECLNRGSPVLCEKPLAPTTEEAEQMIAASRRAHLPLAVGMVRRLSWSSRLLYRLVRTEILGNIQRFDVEEGHEFNWPLRTGHIFQSDQTGGVLADTGPHLLDLLMWILGSQQAQLFSCSDDNWGGVEMNAILELAIESCGEQVAGRIELSFTRKLRNTLCIYGERGCLEAPVLGGPEVLFHPRDGNEEPVVLKRHSAGPRSTAHDFALQLSSFADAIANNSNDYVAAKEALPTIAMIEKCHRSRKLTAQPWEVKHLESFFEMVTNGR